MGKIVLSNLPQSEIKKNSYFYADLHMDLEESFNINSELHGKSEINDFKLDYDVGAIQNSLRNLFTTTPGDKILNPEYGLDFRKYLFLPATKDIAEFIRNEIYSQVARFEPRVKITNVHIIIMEDVNEFDIHIYYNIPTLNIHNISMLGTLSNNGYIFNN
jgi:phage baseplate assembly protein W